MKIRPLLLQQVVVTPEMVNEDPTFVVATGGGNTRHGQRRSNLCSGNM